MNPQTSSTRNGQESDTIVAIATAPGAGGIGVVRLSGPLARPVLSAVFRPAAASFQEFVPRMLHFGHIVDSQGRELDEVLVVFFPGPHSFTGEDTAEVQGHGGPAVLHAVMESLLAAGMALREASPQTGRIRLAERGEFTRRAFLNGHMDLTQAEAVAEIIAAPSPEGVRLASAKLDGLLGRKVAALRDRLEYLRQRVCLAVDFPDEEGECLPPAEFLAVTQEVADGVTALLAGYSRARCWSEGALVVLAGRVNAGKSSLMNALLGRQRAIVTDRPGTTRDYLEEQTNFNGLPVRLVDTAGLRAVMPEIQCDALSSALDPIEQEGIRRGRELMETAQAVLVLFDGSLGIENTPDSPEWKLIQQLGPQRCLAVWNKVDKFPAPDWWISRDDSVNNAEQNLTLGDLPHFFLSCQRVLVSACTGQGLEDLAAKVRDVCAAQAPPAEEIAPNRRQAYALEQALAELNLLQSDILAHMPPDLCGLRLDSATACLADVTGMNSTEETLNVIFADFCIGK